VLICQDGGNMSVFTCHGDNMYNKKYSLRFWIRKESGKYSKAVLADWYSWSKTLYLSGTRLTLRGTVAHYHVKKFENVDDPKKKLEELGFEIKREEKYVWE